MDGVQISILPEHKVSVTCSVLTNRKKKSSNKEKKETLIRRNTFILYCNLFTGKY